MNRAFAVLVVVTLILSALAVLPGADAYAEENSPNVAVVEGTQFIEILAKGNYSPRVTVAKAGIPTVIHLRTDHTRDCTIAVTIPALKYRMMLPTTGVTPVNVPAQGTGSTLQGVCTMGMYGFTIRFV
jgi:hypothetical protein